MSNEQQTKIAQARADFLQQLRRVFESPDGNAVLAWLHSAAATRKPAFVPGDRDPNAAAFRDGRKSLVWEIEANLDQARTDYGKSATGDKPPVAGARARKQRG
jgi:hypothetical protein